MTKLRIFLFAVFLILVAVLIVFPYRKKAPIKIAFLGNLTGNGSSKDIAACNGAMLAVDAVNAKGGITGRQLELSLYDFKGGREKAAEVCHALAEKEISLLIAPFVPGGILAPCMEAGRVLCATSGVAKKGRADKGMALNFRAEDYGAALADLALTRGSDTMAVIYDRYYSPYGTAYLKGFQSRFLAQGGQITLGLEADGLDDRRDDDLAAAVAGIHSKGLMVITSAKAAGRICAMSRKAFPEIALYGPRWVLTDAVLQAGGPLVNGLTGILGEASEPGWQPGPLDDFLEAYGNRYGKKADLSALFGYEVILIMTEGLRNSASPAPFLVKHTLLKLNRFKGLVSDYYLDPADRVQASLGVGEVRDGRISRAE